MNLKRRNRDPVKFPENARRFGELLNMNKIESKITGSVFESLGPGKWEENGKLSRLTLIIHFEACWKKKKLF